MQPGQSDLAMLRGLQVTSRRDVPEDQLNAIVFGQLCVADGDGEQRITQVI